MGLLRLSVLGPPEVFHDERRLSFALRKAEALLLYLAVEGGLHSRSKLAALLWPDSEAPIARNALRNVLTLLRSRLADTPAAPHSHLLVELTQAPSRKRSAPPNEIRSAAPRGRGVKRAR